ncbi:hypothetical protein ACHWQZ_G013953 [Mnemiopsis leidyi]
MELIHHEVQEGQLCAQHCLNTLLQCPVFDAIQLASIAQQLDSEETSKMAEGSSEEYSRFLEQPSSNMDDSGFFSVQVIMRALEVYGLSAKHWKHPDLIEARNHPADNFSALVCNLNQHWFTIRKIGLQWFNIDSCKSGPTLISDTYLEVYLKQLELDGYTIFVILGTLPECQADAVLLTSPLDPSLYNCTDSRKPVKAKEKAPVSKPVETESVEEIRRKRLAKLCGEEKPSTPDLHSESENCPSTDDNSGQDLDDEELRRAIAMSLLDS